MLSRFEKWSQKFISVIATQSKNQGIRRIIILIHSKTLLSVYPTYSDRHALSNSADQDQVLLTAILFATYSAVFSHVST